MIVHEKVLKCNMHCKHCTGEYVLAHNNLQIKNIMKARAMDCIYFRPSITLCNIHEFYNINTQKVIMQRHCISVPTPAYIINEIENQAKKDNMSFGIPFKPKDVNNDLWLEGVKIDEDNDEDEKDNINQDNESYQDMDINKNHKINYDPYKFYIYNQDYEPSILQQQYKTLHITENNSIENAANTNNQDYINDYNEIGAYIMDSLFDNPEEEIIYNNEEVDEDKLDEDYETENNIVRKQQKILNSNEEIQINQEHQDEYFKSMKQPITKYKDFYPFLMNQENHNKYNMEIKEYENYEAEAMLLFMQYQITKTENAKITSVCNSQTYNPRKGILRYANKGKRN